ncbi:DNA-binding transcriptional regulator, PadR family [Jeotgalicoccus aerolatus]|uniref:DNA-binding transcriptional regulator, PadR family n=1 Tax=Jeotgalicoccus aerolatus TaxID=709510 RepID=A0A1G8YB12_9STAP|nr:PadR family transcriptional regulator [Jeotgalicoccus aerolatus]SDJ99435.1 DNA-binding transcriptional regulator, PadR family [Jeotgalicoccus aerolatus]
MRPKLLPLSETMHLIMLALRKPLHGYAIMQLVNEMSDGQVSIAAGTLYGALDNLKKHHYIELLSAPSDRKKVYQVTKLGEEILELENQRLKKFISLYEKGEG